MKTVFLRVIEAEDKPGALRAAIHGSAAPHGPARFQVDVSQFAILPRSPFAYWASAGVLDAFRDSPRLERDGRTAKVGIQTSNDFRFLRQQCEVNPCSYKEVWFPFAKGGAFSPFYSDIQLVTSWADDGHEMKAWAGSLYNESHWSRILKNVEYLLRPGLTWPSRTNGLSVRVMPGGCLFGHKGPAIFLARDLAPEILSMAAVVNSAPFALMVQMQLARTELAQSYEVGLLQNTPVPALTPPEAAVLASGAHRAWSLKRTLDTRAEGSHAFTLPALLQIEGDALASRGAAWADHVVGVQEELDEIQAEIDARCFALYGISDEDREAIIRGVGHTPDGNNVDEEDDENDNGEDAVDLEPLVANLLSWTIGIALGRFDLRLATGERPAPPEPEPFDPLPPCSPGMLTGDDGLPLDTPSEGYPVDFPHDGILVDDPGHDRDLAARARQVFKTVFGEDENAYWHEAAEILEPRTLSIRRWLSSGFFEQHIKKYSKSRRRAPIYWQLATPSASYSVWLYYHRFTRDTLFKVHGEFVAPKVQHEERKLASMRQEAGPTPTASQRKEITAQEDFVAELRAFSTEVARVAPLWNPDLNDGVIINFAPLWRLVPHHKPWLKQCKQCWDKLCKGDYDWAHLAMHLWPERVVPRCTEDRSLAIAHSLEDELWQEDDDGKWQPRKVASARIQELIQERTSPAVKAALDDLLKAPAPATGKKRRAAPRKARPRTATSKKASPEASQGRRGRTPQPVDPATLKAVRDAVAASQDGASKAEILDATGLSDGQWNAAIKELLARGDVTKTGKARGTRYHSSSKGEG